MPWGVAAAAVGAAGAIYSSNQAGKAAEKSAKGSDAASQVQWDMYDQTRKDQSPWLGTGKNALQLLAQLNGVPYSAGGESPGALLNTSSNAPTYNATLYQGDPQYKAAYDAIASAHRARFGVDFTADSDTAAIEADLKNRLGPNWKAPTTSGSSSTPDYSAFYNSPDYKFTFDEGQRAVNAGLAARGLSSSGRAMKELTRYGQGAASTQLNNYRQQLAQMAGIGQATATNLGNTGANTANQVGQNTQNAADSRSSGYLGSANTWTKAIDSGIGTYAYGKGQKWW